MKRTAQLKRTRFKPASRSQGLRATPERKIVSEGIQSAGNGLSANRKTLNPVGKKGSEWNKAKAWLKRHFRYAGITFCEARLRGCLFDDQLSWAHCKKRRKLLDGEIYHVALLCIPCHSIYEALSHEDMHTKIHEIIDRRGLIAP